MKCISVTPLMFKMSDYNRIQLRAWQLGSVLHTENWGVITKHPLEPTGGCWGGGGAGTYSGTTPV